MCVPVYLLQLDRSRNGLLGHERGAKGPIDLVGLILGIVQNGRSVVHDQVTILVLLSKW